MSLASALISSSRAIWRKAGEGGSTSGCPIGPNARRLSHDDGEGGEVAAMRDATALESRSGITNKDFRHLNNPIFLPWWLCQPRGVSSRSRHRRQHLRGAPPATILRHWHPKFSGQYAHAGVSCVPKKSALALDSPIRRPMPFTGGMR